MDEDSPFLFPPSSASLATLGLNPLYNSQPFFIPPTFIPKGDEKQKQKKKKKRKAA
ncbi:predicted protein [Plenodomus lingam JN3]|uniref:Predicted protein n=1 Tax=Leptosphaeria maculans (strain JN3 / isolate v23.1.3 / race Av1-4-5-6-7-8) TaxID=985895 RepID=E4ZHE1_LEPMJ|nr:predicted protein [Plenodomus lingam JN3]CBX90711.1 predicted protein [Plenodomus lingam JN3]